MTLRQYDSLYAIDEMRIRTLKVLLSIQHQEGFRVHVDDCKICFVWPDGMSRRIGWDQAHAIAERGCY